MCMCERVWVEKRELLLLELELKLVLELELNWVELELMLELLVYSRSVSRQLIFLQIIFQTGNS